jgi:hypothetical protein
MYQSLILKALVLVVAVFFFNVFAYKFYFYASISWYDMMMHALGGVFVALLAGALCARFLKGTSVAHILVCTLMSVFAVGLLWEVFEYTVQGFTRGVPFANIPDSLSDLFFDMIGGFVGTLFVIRASKRYNTTHEPVKND